jgi:hypothetical protein
LETKQSTIESILKFGNVARGIRDLRSRVENNPLAYFRPTPPQEKWLRDQSAIKLLLGGNQCGKTFACCAELLYRCLGTHPYYKTDPPPITAFLITHSHQQSITIQEKLWDMCPKNEIHPSVEFVPGKGFRGLHPVVRFNNGSLIMIKTANQGLGLASATVSYVAIDEPVDRHVWGELAARVLRGGAGGATGTIGITMTPVGQNVDYLRELVSQGRVSCTMAPLTVENTTPKGCSPIITQEQIDNIAATYLPIDREARLNGSWDVGVIEGRVFDCFEETMITTLACPPGNYQFCIGIDHGAQPNTQVAILAAVDSSNPQEPKVYVLDEYLSGAAPPEHHIRAIIEMLNRNGLKPEMCKWTGDAAHRGNKKSGRMSNALLRRAAEATLNYPPGNLPFRIITASKPAFSVYYGAAQIHSVMARRNFWIQARCTETIKSLKNWTMKTKQYQRSRDKYGHCVDALRYAILGEIDYNIAIPRASRLRIY